MQPRVTTVGPLVAASATKIAASQTVPGAQGVVLNGALGTYVANNVATSQSLAAAGPVTLVNAKQTLPSLTMAAGLYYSQLYITSGGNDSGITFSIIGRGFGNQPQLETISGSNTGVAASKLRYATVTSIIASGATASTITVGTFLPVVLDTSREIILTSGGNDSGVTFAIKGFDANGNPLSETVAGANIGVATSILSYAALDKITTSGATAGTLTVGTNTAASSAWISLDPWALGTVEGQASVSGTVNYTVQVSNDDPNSPSSPIAPSAMTWDSNAAGVIGATVSTAFGLATAPAYIRAFLNSGTGSVRLTVVQHGNATY